MTHLPYILGSYAAAVAIGLILAGGAAARLRRARRRLAAIDPRGRREEGA